MIVRSAPPQSGAKCSVVSARGPECERHDALVTTPLLHIDTLSRPSGFGPDDMRQQQEREASAWEASVTAPNYDVVIIGAGFTGSALTIQLLRQLRHGSHILLVGAPGSIGRGLAYGTRAEQHLLNVRANRMSILSDDSDHFVNWLERAAAEEGFPLEGAADSYAQRLVYGRYVRETLGQAIAKKRGHVQCDLNEGIVTEVTRSSSGFLVQTGSGARCAASVVALCVGYGPPVFPIRSESVARAACDHIIADPWSDDRMRAIGTNDRVLLIGTGLSMIDQILSLVHSGHKGPLVAISRRGLLPTTSAEQRRGERPPEVFVGPVSLRRLVRQITAAARAEIAAGGDWRAVIDGLRPITQELWHQLSTTDRRRFHRHLEAFWSVHRHRMPPHVARQVESLRKSGQLSVVAGRILTIARAATGVTVALRRRSARTVMLQPFDWIIDCSATGRIRGEADPLLSQLMAQGLARCDRLGGRLDVTRECVVVGRTGTETMGLFALGPLSAGHFFEITAVPEIREQCVRVAQDVNRLLEERTAWGRAMRPNAVKFGSAV